MKKTAITLMIVMVFRSLFSQGPIKSSYSPSAGGGLSSVISNITLASMLNTGENARAELKYTNHTWWTFGLSADQKIGKNVTKATPIDLLHGPATGTKIGINLQKMFWNPLLSPAAFDAFDAAANAYAKRTKKERRLVMESDIEADGTESEREALSGKPALPIFFNIQAYLEKNTYTYSTDSVKLNMIDANYMTPSISLSLILPGNLRTSKFWIISYAYSESYKPADDVTISRPFGTTPNFINQSIGFGAPEKTHTNKVALEYRKAYQFGDKFTAAIDPTLLWTSSKHTVGLQIPVYFIRGTDDSGKPKGLQGGLLIGYSTSDKKLSNFSDGFGAQIFVSSPFDLFGGLK